MRRESGALWASLLLGGCYVPLMEPTPLQGPMPASVVVAPPKLVGEATAAPPELLTELERALRARGYRVLPLDVGFDLIRQFDLLPVVHQQQPGLDAVQRELGVDAVLLLEVGSWEIDPQPPWRADYDLRWRLWSTTGGGELWQHQERGRYQQPAVRDFDPTRGADDPRPIQPFGGQGPQQLRDAAALAAQLHRTAMSHLPRCER